MIEHIIEAIQMTVSIIFVFGLGIAAIPLSFIVAFSILWGICTGFLYLVEIVFKVDTSKLRKTVTDAVLFRGPNYD